ncbi:MAG: TIGR04283 family arsenosugar biosynthesis glycosyltransferase [Gemmatimonadetes bacterium]|nr:TIGR04283 family arsenosugar biosynthesis glycosyltransferase [Gemmatimonadota bacterium]
MRLSVIVPTLNEAAWIAGCLGGIRAAGGADEVLVVDGGSTDATAQIAAREARVLHTPRGRAVQMNAGARHASGDVLLFLHADTVLHPDGLARMRRALADPRVAGGTFTLRFDHPHPLLRFYGACSTLPWLRFGDQGIFVRRHVFDALGGYREMPLLEDVDLLRRMRRMGRLAVVPAPVTTSARRFLERGVVRQQLVNGAVLAAWHLGVSPDRLARWYRGSRRAGEPGRG